MYFLKNKKLFLVALILSCFYLSLMFLIANNVNIYRFLIGGDLILSGSRGWHLFVNYFDYGFIKRGLIGTFFYVTNLSNLIGHEYILIQASTFISASLIVFIVILFLHQNNLIKNNWALITLLLFSPATTHFFAWGGNLDNFLMIIYLVIFLYVKNIWLQAFFIFIGLLVHEAFAFFIPAILFLTLAKHNHSFLGFIHSIVPIIFSAIAAIFLVLVFGETNMSIDEYFLSMKEKMPNIYNEVKSRGALESDLWWSGYNEISYSVNDYRSESLPVQTLLLNAIYVFPATAICIIFSLLCCIFLRREIIYKVLLFLVLTFPILMIVLANDYYRYTSFVMFISIIFLFKGYKENLINKIPDRYLICLLPICLLGPYGGSDLTRPFFILSAYFEKFWQYLNL
jgi:hypothetical protein